MKLLALATAAVLAPAAACAGEAPCWYDQGVVVVSASVAGVAGDYILDTGQAASQLHETRAQAEGLAEGPGRGRVRIAGLVLEDRPFEIADLDLRAARFPTPIAGVIGADLLAGYVVDLSLAPCRVALWPAGRAPRFPHAISLAMDEGPATARAAVADGPRAWAGRFAISTGTDRMVRIDGRYAQAPGARDPDALLPGGTGEARLRALSFADVLFENVQAGLVDGADGRTAGLIGAPALADLRLRFDFPRRRLLIGR